jgi:restriction system protein
MAIPDYQALMLPLLQLASDGQEHRLREAIEELGNRFSLTNDERGKLLPSGSQPVFDNRVGWARTYLKQANLLASPRRGYFQITARGRELLEGGHKEITANMLERFPEFLAFKNRKRATAETGEKPDTPSEETPEDALAGAYETLRTAVESEVLQLVQDSSAAFFERLVLDLLVAMGYGGSRQEAAHAIGQSGDEGIDGIIVEDRLGLDVIYIQAKKWKTNNAVGRPEIQRFAGALQGKRAHKGVFITTSSFTREAKEYASGIDSRIILIDGARLTQLMVDYNIGVSTIGTYEVKSVDGDFFAES